MGGVLVVVQGGERGGQHLSRLSMFFGLGVAGAVALGLCATGVPPGDASKPSIVARKRSLQILFVSVDVPAGPYRFMLLFRTVVRMWRRC